jgi:hypothetical protein
MGKIKNMQGIIRKRPNRGDHLQEVGDIDLRETGFGGGEYVLLPQNMVREGVLICMVILF